jgi:PilZ domain-containing protein
MGREAHGVAEKVLPKGHRLFMSANFVDVFTAPSGAKDRLTVEGVLRTERRARARTQVHWPVLLLRDRGGSAIETITQNLSSTGFYCLSSAGLTPGERLFCTMRVPAHDPHQDGRAISLECTAVVMRSELMADGEFGIACRIEDYHLSIIR